MRNSVFVHDSIKLLIICYQLMVVSKIQCMFLPYWIGIYLAKYDMPLLNDRKAVPVMQFLFKKLKNLNNRHCFVAFWY